MDIQKAVQAIDRDQAESQAKNEASTLGLNYIDLVNYPIAPEVLSLIPEKIAQEQKLIAYLRAGKSLRIATNNPANLKIPEVLAQIPDFENYEITLVVASNLSMDYALNLYKTALPEYRRGSGKVAIGKKTEEEFSEKVKTFQDLDALLQKTSATHLIDLIFTAALSFRASDVHVEPEEEAVRLRFRIDGVLQDAGHLEKDAYRGLLARIKNLANIKLDVVVKPQDGRFDFTLGEHKLDVRISTMPTGFGEMINMRLLSQNIKTISLEELGFRADALKLIEEAISKPHGLILNTGPTGSGKTTTLYSILAKLNQPGKKILTIEDPIEYRLVGIDQSQIEAAKGYDFSNALRSALRQDPDVMMVGEIRDAETAEIAMQSALTGHLVLSTLHTNDAASTFPRLIDMGVKPFLIAGTVNLIIAQRLVRRICPKCQGAGCENCNKLGYKGRMVIAEILKINPEIEKLIHDKASVHEFEEAAKRAGMITMAEDGVGKVKEGLTTQEEIDRVAEE